MSWESLKIVKNIVNHDLRSSDDLNEEEYEITSAKAKHCNGKNNITGELTITNKRISFSSKSRENIISLRLDEIKLVKYNKNIFTIKDKLTIVGKTEENIFRLNYSEDWVTLIEQLLRANSNSLE